MTNRALALSQPSTITSMDDFNLMLKQAETLVDSGFLPSAIEKPAQAVAVMLTGRELGIPTMTALRMIHVIQGKPTASAGLLSALIYRDHGDDALIPDSDSNDKQQASFLYKRRSWREHRRYTFTMDDAKRAGLLEGKNAHSWRKYPANMLRARCISNIATLAFQDTVTGIYSSEELGAEVDPETGEVISQPTISEQVPEAPAAAEPAPTVNTDTGEIVDGEFTEAPAPKRMTQLENRRIVEHAKKHGLWPETRAHAHATYQVDDISELTVDQGRDLYRWISRTAKERDAAQTDAEQPSPAEERQPLPDELNPSDAELDGAS